MRTPLRRSIAQVLKIARAGGRSLRQHIGSHAYRFPRGSAQDLLITVSVVDAAKRRDFIDVIARMFTGRRGTY